MIISILSIISESDLKFDVIGNAIIDLQTLDLDFLYLYSVVMTVIEKPIKKAWKVFFTLRDEVVKKFKPVTAQSDSKIIRDYLLKKYA